MQNRGKKATIMAAAPAVVEFDHSAYAFSGSFEQQCSLDEPTESDAIVPFSGTICHADDPDEFPGRVVGQVTGRLVHYNDIFNRGESFFEIMDGDSSELEEVYGALFDEGQLCEPSFDCWPFLSHIFLVETMEIDKAHRGRGLGLAVMRALTDRIGLVPGYTLIVIKPFPLKADKLTKAAQALAQRKLASYWSAAGFVPIEGSNLWWYFKE